MLKLSITPRAYVGLMGSANTLQVRHFEDRTVIRLHPGTYFLSVFVLIAGAACASGMAWSGFPTAHRELSARIVQCVTGGFAIVLWAVLFRYLRGMPRVEVRRDAGEIQFFKYHWGGPEFAIRLPEVQGYHIDRETYTSRRASYPQHVLVLERTSGQSVPLCGSTDEKLIEQLMTELQQMIAAKKW